MVIPSSHPTTSHVLTALRGVVGRVGGGAVLEGVHAEVRQKGSLGEMDCRVNMPRSPWSQNSLAAASRWLFYGLCQIYPSWCLHSLWEYISGFNFLGSIQKQLKEAETT